MTGRYVRTIRGINMKIQQLSPKEKATDILTGIIIALVSIPISMGYAQVSGLPPVYGLYGSVFPILIFGLLSTSRQFIFGVDAAPAALVGAFLASAGVEAYSEEAVSLIPLISFFVAMWLLLFYVMKAGKLVNYISTPVMGGFISGISSTIILMQIPKLLGGTSGTGEFFELAEHIAETLHSSFNMVSAILGTLSIALLLISKKYAPKIPMSVAVMAAGAFIGYTGFAEKHGVQLLAGIETGLPAWKFPHFRMDMISEIFTTSLTVAIVIMAETLLASNSLANRNGYKLSGNHEILVYGLCNLAAAFTGCCPVNGSVSRSSMGVQYDGKSQIMSITASASMAFILLFCTGFIKYLPVPVLTAIVISALMGAIETHLAVRLFRQDKKELFIFCGAFIGVLLFGTVAGVVIGVLLSFVSVLIRTANPKRSFLGIIPGKDGFHSLERNTYSVPLKGAVIYRFSGNLYFANITLFTEDIENSLHDDTKAVIIDSGAICSIDLTAADSIDSIVNKLKSRGISIYFASHIRELNERFRQLGIGYLVDEGRCRRTITAALAAAGFEAPYVLEETVFDKNEARISGNHNRPEFEWAFGEMAEEKLEEYTMTLIRQAAEDVRPTEEKLRDIVHGKGIWNGIGTLDQEELLDHLQTHIHELSASLDVSEERAAGAIEKRRLKLARRLENNPEALRAFRQHNEQFEKALKDRSPELYRELTDHRRETMERFRNENPDYAVLLEELFSREI